MGNSFWVSPVFLMAVAFTIVFGCYSYIYLPLQMRRAYRQSLLTLARAVETKDVGAEGHGERVARYVVDIAREMRIPRSQILRMEYAALLADIGNVRVPYAILSKKGKLTAEEFEILKQHAVIGAEMVEQVRLLKDLAPLIRHHHECWDGSGYPDGLKGEEIPLGARILAVATAYDSMESKKSFHDKMDDKRAIEELKSNAGVKYDPAVVEAFLKVLQRRWRNERQLS